MNRLTESLVLLALVGCGNGETEPGTTTDTGPDICDTLPDVPMAFSTLRGFSGAEDFAFDNDGGLVSVDFYGNLTSRMRDGTQRVIAPGFGETAGTAYLPDGNLILADAAEGTLLRVAPNGGSEVLLSGLTYPNGVAVDGDGMVYVADQATGTVWKVDGVSGESESIATEMFAPNGVALGGNGTVFVGSFGGGTVHALDATPNGFAEPRLVGMVGDQTTLDLEPCSGAAPGDYCSLGYYYALGTCEGTDTLTCELVLDTAACDGKAVGEACSTELFGEVVDSVCQGDPVFCPYTPAAVVESCEGLAYKATCDLDGGQGVCYPTSQGVVACYDWYAEYGGGCEGLADGDTCQSSDSHFPYVGTCTEYYGYAFCGGTYFEDGGLDGIGVDECDNVYVTEYIAGKIWRFGPEGGDPEEVVELPSSWIPNLHWGNGIGGWETDVLYVMDRDDGRVFELDLGVQSKLPPVNPPAEEGTD